MNDVSDITDTRGRSDVVNRKKGTDVTLGFVVIKTLAPGETCTHTCFPGRMLTDHTTDAV